MPEERTSFKPTRRPPPSPRATIQQAVPEDEEQKEAASDVRPAGDPYEETTRRPAQRVRLSKAARLLGSARGARAPDSPRPVVADRISAVRAPLLLTFAALDCVRRPLEGHSNARTDGHDIRSAPYGRRRRFSTWTARGSPCRAWRSSAAGCARSCTSPGGPNQVKAISRVDAFERSAARGPSESRSARSCRRSSGCGRIPVRRRISSCSRAARAAGTVRESSPASRRSARLETWGLDGRGARWSRRPGARCR